MTLKWAIDYIEHGGFPNDGDRGNEAWCVIKKFIKEAQNTFTNNKSMPCNHSGKAIAHDVELVCKCKTCGELYIP